MYANICPCCGGKTLSKEKENYICLYCGTQFGFVERKPEIDYANLYAQTKAELVEKKSELMRMTGLYTQAEKERANTATIYEMMKKDIARERNRSYRRGNWLIVITLLFLFSMVLLAGFRGVYEYPNFYCSHTNPPTISVPNSEYDYCQICGGRVE